MLLDSREYSERGKNCNRTCLLPGGAFAFCGFGCVLRREVGVALPILARLGADFYQLGGGFLHSKSPIECCEAPCIVGAADIWTGAAVIARCRLQAAGIVGPLLGAVR